MTSLTDSPLADDQAGVVEDLLLIVGAEDLALPQVRDDARRLDRPDQKDPVLLQRVPALLIFQIGKATTITVRHPAVWIKSVIGLYEGGVINTAPL